jgi:tetratricopeptide (TPR) repeat protein
MSSTEDFLSTGVERFEAGDYREAAEIARQGIGSSPDDGRLWQLYGLAQWSLGHLLQAREALERVSCLIPLNETAQCALADCYLRLGQPESARAIYTFLAEKEVREHALLPAVAAGLGKLAEYEMALYVCRKIVQQQPNHHQALFGIAFYLNRLGAAPENLIPPLSLALKLAPHLLTYRLNLAFVFAELHRYAEAYALLQTVPLEAVRCPCWLQRMSDIFARVHDDVRQRTCQRQLETMTAPRA